MSDITNAFITQVLLVPYGHELDWSILTTTISELIDKSESHLKLTVHSRLE